MTAGLPLDKPRFRRSSTESVLGDVAEADRRAVAVGDHQVLVILRLTRLVVVEDLPVDPGVLDRALRAVGVCRGKRRAHVLQSQSILEECRRVQLDADRRERAAENPNIAHAATWDSFCWRIVEAAS